MYSIRLCTAVHWHLNYIRACIVRTERDYPPLTGILTGSLCSRRSGSVMKVFPW